MAVPADDDLAVVAELRGMVIEMLEARNAELSGRVAELEERLARLERALTSGNEAATGRARPGNPA